MLTLKARFDGHVFIPAEPVDLPTGCELEILVSPRQIVETSGSTLAQLVELADQFPENPDLPTDLAAQHDHYLYGTPKRP
ncbi:MAG: antitoxin family protein [Planctomycetales bacterium]|nr:antitoxin family protein [Planctomycetales bacterium]